MKYLLPITLLLSSCATLKRQKVLGGLVGAIVVGSVGASIGKSLSPNPESDRLNQTLGGVTAASIGLFLGMKTAQSLWEDNPKNHPVPIETYKGGSKIKVIRPENIKRIKLETKLPPFLQGKVKEANVITYELESYEEEMEDGRKIIHEPHKAYEYVIE